MRQWLELLRRLGDAVLELAEAEVGALADDLRRGGRQAARALLLVAIASVLAALAGSLLTVALILGLVAARIEPWLAALAVAAAYAAAAVAFAAAARRRWRATELPLDTVKRRWSEQNAWFRDRVLSLPPSEEGTEDD